MVERAPSAAQWTPIGIHLHVEGQPATTVCSRSGPWANAYDCNAEWNPTLFRNQFWVGWFMFAFAPQAYTAREVVASAAHDGDAGGSSWASQHWSGRSSWGSQHWQDPAGGGSSQQAPFIFLLFPAVRNQFQTEHVHAESECI